MKKEQNKRQIDWFCESWQGWRAEPWLAGPSLGAAKWERGTPLLRLKERLWELKKEEGADQSKEEL